MEPSPFQQLLLDHLHALNDKPKQFIVSVSLLGLANRLRIIAALFSIATQLGAFLTILWFKDDACSISFHDMFSINSASRISILDYQGDRLDDIKLNEEVYQVLQYFANEINDPTFAWSTVTPFHFYIDPSHFKYNISFVRTRGVHTLLDTSCNDFMNLKSQFYSFITPTAAVMQVIDVVQSYFSNNQVFGVHIRSYDSNYDWAMVSPTSSMSVQGDSNKPARRFDQVSSVQAFIDIMTKIISTHPEVLFYVASNSESSKQAIFNHFGEQYVLIISSDLSQRRSDYEGMILAAAEFLLLGETTNILHSHASSFAREAGARNKVPVLDVLQVEQRNEDTQSSSVAFYSSNINLPYCAMPEYIRLGHVTKVERVCYVEDGNRVMCSRLYEVCPCGHYSHCPMITRNKGGRENLNGSCHQIVAESNGYSID